MSTRTAQRSFVFDSTVESIEPAVEVVHRFAEVAGVGESDLYFLGIAVREVIINAIRHGNRFDPNKKIGLMLSEDGRELTIEVTDQGEGFRLENVPDPRLPENRERTSGRGIALARASVDTFSVEQQPEGGARVRLVKRLPAQEAFPA